MDEEGVEPSILSASVSKTEMYPSSNTHPYIQGQLTFDRLRLPARGCVHPAPYLLVVPMGFEPMTSRLKGENSIPLSYGTKFGGQGGTRTPKYPKRCGLQPHGLPVSTTYPNWSDRWESNPRPPPWQGGVLPD